MRGWANTGLDHWHTSVSGARFAGMFGKQLFSSLVTSANDPSGRRWIDAAPIGFVVISSTGNASFLPSEARICCTRMPSGAPCVTATSHVARSIDGVRGVWAVSTIIRNAKMQNKCVTSTGSDYRLDQCRKLPTASVDDIELCASVLNWCYERFYSWCPMQGCVCSSCVCVRFTETCVCVIWLWSMSIIYGHDLITWQQIGAQTQPPTGPWQQLNKWHYTIAVSVGFRDELETISRGFQCGLFWKCINFILIIKDCIVKIQRFKSCILPLSCNTTPTAFIRFW
jgi:hypothetical protein